MQFFDCKDRSSSYVALSNEEFEDGEILRFLMEIATGGYSSPDGVTHALRFRCASRDSPYVTMLFKLKELTAEQFRFLCYMKKRWSAKIEGPAAFDIISGLYRLFTDINVREAREPVKEANVVIKQQAHATRFYCPELTELLIGERGRNIKAVTEGISRAIGCKTFVDVTRQKPT